MWLLVDLLMLSVVLLISNGMAVVAVVVRVVYRCWSVNDASMEHLTKAPAKPKANCADGRRRRRRRRVGGVEGGGCRVGF